MDGFEVVADELLIEGGLRAAGGVGRGWPVARGIGSEDLVGEGDLSVDEAELELGVGEDEAFAGGVRGGAVVDIEGEQTKGVGVGEADDGFDLAEGDVLVVAAGVDLGGGGEDGLGEAIGFEEAGGYREAADFTGGLVVLPAGAGDIAADDALDGKHLSARTIMLRPSSWSA